MLRLLCALPGLCRGSALAWLALLSHHISFDSFASDGPFQSTLSDPAAFSFEEDSHTSKEMDISCTNPMAES